MSAQVRTETLVDRRVSYTLELEGRFYIVENVPARVCEETGEQFFAPDTVERLQQITWEGRPPKRMVEKLVFEFDEA